MRMSNPDESILTPLDFTRRAEDQLYSVVDQESFLDQDADLIYESLKTKTRLIPFCDHLKRYVFRKAGLAGDYQDIDMKVYQQIISDAFSESATPKAFTETTAKMGALTKNWLTRAAVSRQTVFLLGFGLGMGVDDVADFLMKGLREHSFNFKDPMEIICWYCFKHGYSFAKMQLLRQRYESMSLTGDSAIYYERTRAVYQRVELVKSDDALMDYLVQFKVDRSKGLHSVTAQRWFDDLYWQCCAIIAQQKTILEEEKTEQAVETYRTRVKNSSKYSEEEKQAHVADMRREAKRWTAEEIGGADFETYLCTIALKTDTAGKVIDAPVDHIAKEFDIKRFTRQHVFDLLKDRTPVNRYDLLTLLFFVHAHKEDADRRRQLFEFWQQADEMLLDCSMGELYTANPYECFLLMCMVSEGPTATFADVWQKMIEDKNE